MRQVAGVVVGGGGGRVEAEGRQGGHAELLGRVVGTEAAQVILSDCARRNHVVDRPLEAGGQGDGYHPTLPPKGDVNLSEEMSPPPWDTWRDQLRILQPLPCPIHRCWTHLRGGKRESWTTELGGSPKE